MSGFVETLLVKLDTALMEQAVQSLIAPQGHDGFDYGRACGVYAGLHRARDILREMLSEVEDHDDQL